MGDYYETHERGCNENHVGPCPVTAYVQGTLACFGPDEELPPVVRRVAEQIDRGARNFSPSEAVAGVICSTGEVAAGLAALPVLERLKERHQPRDWGGIATSLTTPSYRRDERVTVCAACNTSWPCRDAEILGVE